MSDNYRAPRVTGTKGARWRWFAEPEVAMHSVELLGTAFVGFGSYMNRGSIRSYSEIGRYCSIGRDVSVGLGRHDLTSTSTSPFFNFSNSTTPYEGFATHNPVRRTVIGSDVWIGDGARINTGVTVGHGAIIATGAVVVNDVEPYSIVGGIPAKHIRWRFDAEIRRRMLNTRWWEYEPFQLAESMVSEPSTLVQIWPNIVKQLRLFPVKYTSLVPEAVREDGKS